MAVVKKKGNAVGTSKEGKAPTAKAESVSSSLSDLSDSGSVSETTMDFEVFYRQPDCQCLRNQLLYEKYYGRSTIDSPDAMESFVLPNLKQLPSCIL
jgi:hypothetical protein